VKGGKRRRGLINGKRGSVKRERERSLDQRERWKVKRVFGKRRIKIIKASWTRVLFED
jgi:hypothetical protein